MVPVTLFQRITFADTSVNLAGYQNASRETEPLALSRASCSGAVRTFVSLRWMLIALLALGGLLASFDARAENSAEGYVRSSIDRSYAILNDRKFDAAERQREFAAQIRSQVDTRRVALFTLGPYGRDASKEDLEAYTAAFTEYLTSIYHQALSHYKDRSITVTGSTVRSEDDVIVNAVVGHGGTQLSDLHIAFRVRRSDRGGDTITDFQAEGAWLALTQRADFSSYLQQHGGNLMLLSHELQGRAEKIRSDLAGSEARP